MFDFDATLPLMAVQFLILMILLNQIFYKPLGQAIDLRTEYIRKNQAENWLNNTKRNWQQHAENRNK